MILYPLTENVLYDVGQKLHALHRRLLLDGPGQDAMHDFTTYIIMLISPAPRKSDSVPLVHRLRQVHRFTQPAASIVLQLVASTVKVP